MTLPRADEQTSTAAPPLVRRGSQVREQRHSHWHPRRNRAVVLQAGEKCDQVMNDRPRDGGLLRSATSLGADRVFHRYETVRADSFLQMPRAELRCALRFHSQELARVLVARGAEAALIVAVITVGAAGNSRQPHN